MNCSFNIRYKPRTTRAFTKNDLTVYDSAGNTALNALTVYGKSEVVDGSIKSAGEGYAVVDLGTLNWTYESSVTRFYASLPSQTTTKNRTDLICAKYKADVSPVWDTHIDKTICFYAGTNVYVNDYDYTDATTFKNSLNGVLLCYKLANPAQGNCIAVKTDNGTGINGTMAVFTTGTPLRGIPDTAVKDSIYWDGSAGTATKNCGGVRLADLEWQWWNQHPNIIFAEVSDKQLGLCSMICSAYPYRQDMSFSFASEGVFPDKTVYCSVSINQIFIKNTDYNTKEDFVASLGDAELIYELVTPITTPLTQAENASIAGLRAFEPQTHVQNNAGAEMTLDYTIRVPTI